MPQRLALALTVAFIGGLFWHDSRRRTRSSGALWLPVIWIFIVGSKFVSQWLSLFGLPLGDASLEGGSPIDAVFFFLVIFAGLLVLSRRNVELAEFARNNVWLTVFLVYCFLAIAWSDFPLVAFKRWIKILGHPIMAMVVLTDPDPEEALRKVLSRSGYLLLPLSILFIKYYPEYGRSFDAWTGAASNAGINNNKNELGYVCMIFGLFFLWNLLSFLRVERRRLRTELAITIVFLWIVWWLFSVADSATSLACVLVGAATMAIVRLPVVSKRFIGSYILVGLIAIVTAQMSFGVYDKLVALLGRNTTLTDRTVVWHDALAIDTSPVFGAGFESFWLGSRLDKMWAKWWWRPTQAHNGYIETYLNLGWVGVAILVILIIATFRKTRRELLRHIDFGLFRLGVLFPIIIYNYTEATFKGVHLVWTLFYLIAIDYPATGSAVSDERLSEPSTDALLADPRLPVSTRWPHPVAVLPGRTSLERFAGGTPQSRSQRWR